MYLLDKEMSVLTVLLLALFYVSEQSESIPFLELGRRPEELQREGTDPAQLSLYTKRGPEAPKVHIV